MNSFWLVVFVVLGGICLYTGEIHGVVIALVAALVGTWLEGLVKRGKL